MRSLGLKNPDFKNRLLHLYKVKGIDTKSRAFTVSVAKEFFSKGIISYKENTDKSIAQQNNDLSRQLRAHLERENVPDNIWLIRYHQYFGCSVDYLLGIIDKPTYDYKTVMDIIGFDEITIDRINKFYDQDSISMLNKLIKDDDFRLLIECFNILQRKGSWTDEEINRYKMLAEININEYIGLLKKKFKYEEN